mgnify:CR=1 FL=1
MYFYEKHLQELGFSIIKLDHNGNFFEYLAQEIHRIPDILNRYTSRKVSWFERWVIQKMLMILSTFNKNDKGSGEFLCWGYHCLAKKK